MCIEFGPLGNAVDIGCRRSRWHRRNLIPRKLHRALDQTIDSEVPFFEVHIGNAAGMQDGEPLGVILTGRQSVWVDTHRRKTVPVSLEERHGGTVALNYLEVRPTVPSMRPLALRSAVLTIAILITASACSSQTSSADGTANQSNDRASGSTTAEIAPIFSVPTASGDEFSLSEHLATDGRPLFLNLWASWCFPCREEMPAIDRSSQSHPEIAFVGVSVQDSTSDATSFAEEIGVTYTIGFDENDVVDDAYSPLGLPASYVISADGVILERIFGRVTEDDLDAKFASYFG
jgi:thiol-disulfide isomerase/thioredoxin